MCTHSLCFEQKYEKYKKKISAENFQFLKIRKYLFIAWASFRNVIPFFALIKDCRFSSVADIQYEP